MYKVYVYKLYIYFIKVNSPKHVGGTGNHWLILIKIHWSYFKCNGLLHTLNAYTIAWKEHQVVDFESLMNQQLWKYCFGNVKNMSPNIT